METLERWLKTRALVTALLLALVVSWVLSSGGVASEDVMPFGDSEHYVLRGMTLYGYLHTGQWSRFWDLFTLPRQSLAPLHYWIFFLLPPACAGITSYGIIQALSTYGLMALGAWMLCRALDRVEWTAPLFLLCASQNISLDFSYFYFADIPFCAMGMVALAWQVRAWREAHWTSSLLSGLGPALLFWIKAPNALIFSAVYFLSEIIRLVLTGWRSRTSAESRLTWRRNLLRHASGVMAGYLPMTLLTLACGGLQSIMKLIDANEVSGLFVTQLTCTGLWRLLYFPLCLTFFYNTVVLLLLFGVVILVAVKRNRADPAPLEQLRSPFPAGLWVPLIVAYVLYGEFYSFGMLNKEMRAFQMVLPIFWLAVFWVLDGWRVRSTWLFLAAIAYVACGYSQILFDAFGTKEISPSSYQLENDWLDRFPQARFVNPSGMALSRNLVETIQQAIPEGGKVAVGTEQLYLTSESLSWVVDHQPALQGKESPEQFSNFLMVNGEFNRGSLQGARGILLFVHPAFQYSKAVHDASIALLQYADKQWVNQDHAAQILTLGANASEPLGFLIVMKEPLTDEQITGALRATGAAEFAAGAEFNMLVDRRLSWSECWELLQRWKEKRLGR